MADSSYQYQNDPAFQALAPADQLHYMSSQDPDFQKLSPPDQLGYLAHLRGLSPVQGPQLPQPPSVNPSEGMITIPPPGRIPGATMPTPQVPPDQAAEGIAAGGAAGALGLGATTAAGGAILSGAGTAIKTAGKALPYVAASEGINYARQNLPLGKYIPPGAELLPFFMGGGKPGEEPPPKRTAPPPLRYSPQPEPVAGPTAAPPPLRYSPQPEPATGPTVAPPPLRWNESLPDRVPTTRPEGGPPEGAPVAIGQVPQAGPRPNGPYSGPNTPASMEPAQSGMIAKHGYIPESRTMVTEFNNGKVYQYTGVPKEIYDNFRNAESQGSFFAQNIKGRYTTRYRGSVSPTRSSQ